MAIKKDKTRSRQYIKSFLLSDERLEKSDVQVYGYIYGLWEDLGNCISAIRTIAPACNLAKSTVQLSIRRLEEYGYIYVVHGSTPEGGAKTSHNTYKILKKPPVIAVAAESLFKAKRKHLSKLDKERRTINTMLSMAHGLGLPESTVSEISQLIRKNNPI